MFHGVGKPYFNGRHLIPGRFFVIIDRALSIGPIDYVSSVKKRVLLGKSQVKLAKPCPIDHGGRRRPTAAMVPHSRCRRI